MQLLPTNKQQENASNSNRPNSFFHDSNLELIKRLNSLLQNNFGGSLGVEPVAALVRDDGGHALPDGVEGVDPGEGLLGVPLAHALVALSQRHHEAEQGALRLVAHLHRGTRGVLVRL